ncbi:hypothetical protein [Phenylobacterium sp.]|jgi:hypothetical protein|uniref:hypothetical protein n=1 Tax=Phenylobacterium sp. TaxID=1871053 RepID=UPI0037C5F51B
MISGTKIREHGARRQARALALLPALAILVMSMATQAAPNPPASLSDRRADTLEALSACRAVSDPAARLACYDSAAGRLDEAEKTGEIVVVDRKQAGEVRRQAFGFAIPSLALFEKAEGAEKLDRVESTLKAARQGADGKWILQLENGAVWRQTDTENLIREPRPGSRVAIKSAALGSYLMSVDGQRSFRARREE